jgi:ribosome-binding factor A
MESKRRRQIAELIKRNFSMVLLEEGRYIYGDEVMVSVTNVKVSPDLRLGKIYLSIFNAQNKTDVLEALQHNIIPLKQNLVGRIRKHVRFIPDIALYNDDLLDEMDHVNRLLDDL